VLARQRLGFLDGQGILQPVHQGNHPELDAHGRHRGHRRHRRRVDPGSAAVLKAAPLTRTASQPPATCPYGRDAAIPVDATSRNDIRSRVRQPASMPGQAKTRRKIHPLRDALLAGLCTFVVSAVGLTILYLRARDAQVDAVRTELLQLARATAAQIDGDLLETLVSPA